MKIHNFLFQSHQEQTWVEIGKKSKRVKRELNWNEATQPRGAEGKARWSMDGYERSQGDEKRVSRAKKEVAVSTRLGSRTMAEISLEYFSILTKLAYSNVFIYR